MSDAGNPASTTPAAGLWYEGLDPDLRSHATRLGLDRLDPAAAAASAVKSHYEADRLLSNDANRMPRDATDPRYREAFERLAGMTTPATPEEYKLDGVKFSDGTALDEDDIKFVREVAVKYKLPIHVATGLAADLAARVDLAGSGVENTSQLRKAANQVALRTHWGGHYDAKAFSVSQVAGALGLSPSVLEHMASLDAPEYVQNMEALANLSTQFNEATILRGGAPVRDASAGLTPQGATDRLNALSSDPAWRTKFLAGDTATNQEWEVLTQVIADGRRQAQFTGIRR